MQHGDYVSLLEQAVSIDDVYRVCKQLTEAEGFDNFLYAAMIPTSLTKPYIIVIGNYPAAWRDLYDEKDYRNVDPTVLYCLQHGTPLKWRDIPDISKHDPLVSQFLDDAKSYGLESGVSIPIPGHQGEKAMISFSTHLEHDACETLINNALPTLHSLSSYLHEVILRIVLNKTVILEDVSLTTRERECLLWAAEGKTSWEVAQIMGISERTVIYHLKNSADKLQVNSRLHAVSKAVSSGLIQPDIIRPSFHAVFEK